MEKLRMQTAGKVDKNIGIIAEFFPACVTETLIDGKLTQVVDFDLLKTELSNLTVEGDDERFQFTWADKRKSVLLANAPISKTLRPCRTDSVNFDTTQNLYIEGDNLDVLKLLQETYMGKVKVMYIDPPYNTGKDSFLYDDDRSITEGEFIERSGLVDEQGHRLHGREYRENNESNGRFHTDWLNMMYPRLKLAKELLTDDGVIFISMDESEVDNLLKICNEIFGRRNFIGQFIWENRTTPNDPSKLFAPVHEFVLIYAKDADSAMFAGVHKDTSHYTNPDNDPSGAWIKDNPSAASGSVKDRFAIVNPHTGEEYFPPKGRFWAFSQKRVAEWTASGKLWFPQEKGKNFVLKKYLTDLKSDRKPIPSIITSILTMHGTKEMAELFPDDDRVFKYPKPTKLLKTILAQVVSEGDIVMDFFSGSAPTADAVMQLNAEQGLNLRFILVQLNEECSEDSEAFNAGYENICEVGKERIRRAGKRVAELSRMTAPNTDIGFRVLRLDSSNMKPVFYNPDAIGQDLIAQLESNIKDDRTAEDLLFQVMLDMGIELSSDIKVENIGGKTVYTVGGDNLVCCFDTGITKEVVTAIAKRKPLYAIFRDSGFERDDTLVSFDQIFETYSPTTERRVL